MENKTYLTAIKRRKLPKPTEWLLSVGFIVGDVLDYGCGKCSEVNQQLKSHLLVKSLTNYDPHYVPEKPTGQYDVILCNYVLCVTPKEEEESILSDIRSLLKPNNTSVAFIAVRNDVPKQGFGFSKKQTFQRKVELPFQFIKKTTGFKIYAMYK